jgi:hypothetical protein
MSARQRALRFAFAAALLLQTGCINSWLSDCNVGGTGDLSGVDAATMSVIQFDPGGPYSVEVAGFANETDPRHLVFTLPSDLYVGRRGVSSFSVQDGPIAPEATFTGGVVDWEVTGQELDTQAGGDTHPRYQVRLTGFGADDNRTHFQGTCPIEAD